MQIMHSTRDRPSCGGFVWCIVALVLALSSTNAHPSSGGSGGGCIFSRLGKGKEEPRHPESKVSSSSSRRLLQSECSLELSGTPYTFTACQDYTDLLGSSMTLHYSVSEGENGGNITMRGGIDAAYTEGEYDYVGFGFQPEQAMIGGNVVIVQACSECASGASIDDYYLSAEEASGVNTPSQMSVPFKSAALSGGRFQAVFELMLTSDQATLASAGVIFAAGPISSSGELQQHILYGGSSLDMTPGVTSDLGEALSPLEASASAPGPSDLSPSPSPSESVSTSEVPAVAPSADLPACSLQYSGNNSVLTFTNCEALTTSTTANSDFKLFWNLEADPSGSGSIMRGALETSQSNSWAGFGFPSSPGVMVGTQSVIVHPCSSCSSGAEADKYYLASTEASDINSGTGDLQISNVEASERGGGGVQALFTLTFTESISELDVSKDIIAAIGPSTATGRLNSHPTDDAFTGSVNFASGATVGGESSRQITRKVVAHGALMIAGWGLVLPLGVVFARCKEWGAIWFHLHRAFQVLGYCAGAAGAGLGWSFGRPTGTNLEQNHRIVGWTVWLLLTIQMLSLFWRPKPGKNALRRTWAAGHWFGGSASVFMAFANVFIGLKVSGQRALWSGLYALAFALILLLWILKMGYNLTILKRKQSKYDEFPATRNGNGSTRKSSPAGSSSDDTRV